MRLLGIIVVLVLAAGCTDAREDAPADDPPSPTSSPSPAATVVEGLADTATPAWSRDLEALQAPVSAGDVLVVVVTARTDELDVVALDASDGAVRWRRPLMVVDSSIGAYLGDLVHEAADGTEYVVMQQAPTGRRLSAGIALPYLAIEPNTGKVVARTRPVAAQFAAPSCDDGLDACLRISSEDRFKETRWVLGSWKLRPEEDSLPAGTNSLVAGSDVYTVYGPVRNYAVAKAIGRVGPSAWRLPHGRVTGSDRWLLDNGTGLVDEEAGVVVAQLLETPQDSALRRYEQGKEVRLDLASRRTVGLDLATGKVLWRHRGADLRCLELTRTELPVRCAFTGTRVHREDRDTRLESARGFLEGFDPRTGETTWRQELAPGAVRTLALDIPEMDAEVDRIADGDDLVVVPTPDGPRLLSLVDGSLRPLPEGEALLCTTSVPFRHRLDTDGEEVVGFGEQRARRVVDPCTAKGRSTATAPGATALLTAGVDAGEDLRIIVRRGVVEAYRLL